MEVQAEGFLAASPSGMGRRRCGCNVVGGQMSASGCDPLPRGEGRIDYCTRLSTSSFTTAGSASVDVSPRLSVSFAAILRRILRMILPLRVFGSAGAH